MAPVSSEITEVLDEGRAEMAGLFSDTGRVTKNGVGGRGDFNETSGQYDNTPARVVVYEGPLRMQVKADINSNVVETTAGDREWTYLTGQMQLPAVTPLDDPAYVSGSVDDVDVDNVVEWLTSPHSASLAGRVFNVAGPYHKSHAVYLRFRIRESVA